MSTSIHSRRVRYNTSSAFGQNFPLDVSSWRTLHNNVCHQADEASQVRVAWCDQRGAAGLTKTLSQTNRWERLGVFGPFPLSIRADGTPYPLRCSIGGYNRTGAVTSALLGLAIGPIAVIDSILPLEFSSVTTSASSHHSLYGGVGAVTANNADYVNTAVLDLQTRPFSNSFETLQKTRTSVSDSTPLTVEWWLAYAGVYGRSTSVQEVPHVTAVTIAEYIG